MSGTIQIAVIGTRFGEPDIEQAALRPFPVEFVLGPGHTAEEIVALAREATIVLAGGAPKFTAGVIEQLSACQAIVRYGVGVDTVDRPAASERGIIIANVPDYATEEVSTHTVALILALMRKIGPAQQSVAAGDWHITNVRPLFSAAEQTLAIVGFGRIGQAVARKCRPFGFNIIVLDPFADEPALVDVGATAVSLDSLIEQADIVSLNAPLVDDTYHLINEDVLSRLKPSALIVNTSRGGLIDEGALLSALASGQIAGAALDVSELEPMPPDHPLLQYENVIVTPHMAWYTEQATARMRQYAAREAKRILLGELPLNLVNPEFSKTVMV